MTSIPLGSAGYPGQGWRAQLAGSPQAGLCPKGRVCIPQDPLPKQIPDHLSSFSPPFTRRLLLPSAFMVPTLEVMCGLNPLKTELFLASIGRARQKGNARPDSVTDQRPSHNL